MDTNFKEKFDSFYIGVQKIYTDHMQKYFPKNTFAVFSYEEGSRYIRIFRDNSAHAFIDKKTGDVLKASSYNKPAKHARGNIFDEFNGLRFMDQYGPLCLK